METIQVGVKVTLMILDHIKMEDTRKERVPPGKERKLSNKPDREYPYRGGPPDVGGPPYGGGPLMMEDPLMVEDPLMMEDPPGNGRPPGRPRGQGPPGPPGPPGPVCPIIVQQPQVTLDTTSLKTPLVPLANRCCNWPEHKTKPIGILQEHLQQGQVNIQAHTGTLQQLATSTYQRNFESFFASIPIYDGSSREDFFPWLECLEAACFYSGRNIKTEALGRSAGPVQNVIMALPDAHSWKAIREELNRCFFRPDIVGTCSCPTRKHVTKT